jgi:hypothetical protein
MRKGIEIKKRKTNRGRLARRRRFGSELLARGFATSALAGWRRVR